MNIEIDTPAKSAESAPVKQGFFSRIINRMMPAEEDSLLGANNAMMTQKDFTTRIWADRIFLLLLFIIATIYIAYFDSESKARTEALEKKVEIIIDTVNQFGSDVDKRLEMLEKRTNKLEERKKAESQLVN